MPTGGTISHVMEYHCQYTDQLRKKRKAWHDGKLKYFQLTNKFQLFTEGGILLCSEFVTNSRQLGNVLDQEGFGNVEHRIFGSYVVIISDLEREYDNEINLYRPHHQPKMQALGRVMLNYKRTDSSISPSNAVANKEPSDQTSCNITTDTNTTAPITRHTLSLQLNKPFKPPKLVGSPTLKPNALMAPRKKAKTVQACVRTSEATPSMTLAFNKPYRAPRMKSCPIQQLKTEDDFPTTQTSKRSQAYYSQPSPHTKSTFGTSQHSVDHESPQIHNSSDPPNNHIALTNRVQSRKRTISHDPITLN
ncbi:Mte1p Ecym_6142 [Eremothecium cymbalariae DBVPG|uniref:5'-3' DNA helicase ZGRF1-like N-terminal domain-containing protein n=1 Tax=Eremothecium cymbalariae (strain CBS 270.75 / DBVPG 7215 / KCTC 17166 / NRRL Y-17582) TaxID=931890 RepID=G8JV54_ERECY|nr:hypothetical protein Ecym_6142 [Eremothecium cymbalariae DBVPG\